MLLASNLDTRSDLEGTNIVVEEPVIPVRILRIF